MATGTDLSDADLGVFRLNRESPFHRWVHLTEAFSTQLVAREVAEISEDGIVYDPFGGTATTPLTAVQLGRNAFWAEVNPWLRLAGEAKVRAATAGPDERRAAAAALADAIEAGPANAKPDHPLLVADAKRLFFPPGVADDLLGWVAAIDDLDSLARDAGRVAVAGAAIAVSNMKRAVDLRRRTPREMEVSRPSVGKVVRERLAMVADDLRSDAVATGVGRCVSADARAVDEVIPAVDLVVTSPPYLNGTNYCRNTKLELLLLALIESEAGLRSIRTTAITAGINNVSARLAPPDELAVVEPTATALDQVAYDRRIPLMVRAYFSDMRKVLTETARLCRPNAQMVLDIGDSRFAGIHVDTPALLSALAGDVGWRPTGEQVIRERTSKDGSPLCQKLLRFSLTTKV